MENKEIRRRNLELLIQEEKTIKALADKCGVSGAYISQIRSDTIPGEVGDDLARRLERGTGKPVGWMDSPQWLKPVRNARTAPTAEEWELIEAYRACDRADQETVFDLAQRLRKK